MRAWVRQHFDCLRNLARNWRSAPLVQALNIAVIGIALALPLGAYVLLHNLQGLADPSQADAQLNVYMAAGAGKAELAKVETALRDSAAVRRQRFIPKDEALRDLSARTELGDVVAILGENPLPDTYVADLKPGATDEAKGLAARLEALPKVERVQLDSLWLERLHAFLRLGERLVLLLGVLLGCGLAAVTFNTVRAQIAAQKDEIEISTLIGATHAYVRRPFLYQGAVLGLVGGLFATALIEGGLLWLDRAVLPLAQSYGSSFHFALPPGEDLVAAVLVAGLLGWAGASLSVSAHLRSLSRTP